MLVQQPDESSLAFHTRLMQRVKRGQGRFVHVVLMRAALQGEPLPSPLRSLLAEPAAVDLEVYPRESVTKPSRLAG